ncbi:GNAT family N-acetyltransferase [Roseateles oligotrophus]|uniref:GNAT family N-acetyltransferase n=1 Tax=Roseateles oligotrophus TaxID=1769250 RepID=A0ABT2Y8L3_9BURK|nr:GNAT family N-acetyltransferase [Roseateles oligotrophus]MCV2366636.1 GNAT family N-acetyltransferase [Roseateles oligotrophus]
MVLTEDFDVASASAQVLAAFAASATARLLLREPRADDLDAVFELHADPVCTRCSASATLGRRDEAQALLQGWLAHWQTHGFGYWVISAREQPDAVIGFGGVMHKTIDGISGPYLYFRFRPQAWGQGFASEMALRALDLSFTVLKQAQVLAIVLPANTPSRKTLERIGMLLKSALADVPGQPPSLVYELTALRFAGLPKVQPAPTPFGA